MAKELVGKVLTHVERREYDWVFSFSDDVHLAVPSLWRIVKDERVAFCGDDHAHQFGLPAPLDGVEVAKKLLSGKKITAVSVRADTGDLAITFNNAVLLEVLTASGGYEGWRLSIRELEVVVQGGGKLICWTDTSQQR